MPTSARYISLNKCENQRPKAVQPATKQSTGLFLPNLQTNLEQLVVVRVQFKKTKRTEHTFVCSVLLAPQVGLEPTTLRLTAACSTN